MRFKDIEIDRGVTVQDLYRAMVKCENADEAQELKRIYREIIGKDEVADMNLGYITGYADNISGARLRKWFEVKHPVWDFDAEPNPTFEQLIEAGGKWAMQQARGEAA